MNLGDAVVLSAVAGAAWLVTDTVTSPPDPPEPPAAMQDDDLTQTTANWPASDAAAFAGMLATTEFATPVRAPAISLATEEFQALYSRWKQGEQMRADLQAFAEAEAAPELTARSNLLQQLATAMEQREDTPGGALQYVQRRANVWAAVGLCRQHHSEAQSQLDRFQYQAAVSACDRHLGQIAQVTSDLSQENTKPFPEDAAIENPWSELLATQTAVSELRSIAATMDTATTELQSAKDVNPPPESVKLLEQWQEKWRDGNALAAVPDSHTDPLRKQADRTLAQRQADALFFTVEAKQLANGVSVAVSGEDIAQAMHLAFELSQGIPYADIRQQIRSRVARWLANGIQPRRVRTLHPLLKEAIGKGKAAIVVGVFLDDEESDDVWNYWQDVATYQKGNVGPFRPTTNTDIEDAPHIDAPPRTPAFVTLTQRYNEQVAKARTPEVILTRKSWETLSETLKQLEAEGATYRTRAAEHGVKPSDYVEDYKTLSFATPAQFAKNVIQFFENEKISAWDQDDES